MKGPGVLGVEVDTQAFVDAMKATTVSLEEMQVAVSQTSQNFRALVEGLDRFVASGALLDIFPDESYGRDVRVDLIRCRSDPDLAVLTISGDSGVLPSKEWAAMVLGAVIADLRKERHVSKPQLVSISRDHTHTRCEVEIVHRDYTQEEWQEQFRRVADL